MTQDEIIRMAREAGLHGLIQHRFVVEKYRQELSPKLERFAALVVEATKRDVITLCKNWDFNVQSLIRQIEDMK